MSFAECFFSKSKWFGKFSCFLSFLTALVISFSQVLTLAQTPFGFNGFNDCAYNGTNCDGGVGGSGISNNGLRLWYDAGSTDSYSGSSQTINDLSGNNNHGTLGLNNQVASDDPVFNSSGVKSFTFSTSEIINTSLTNNFSNSFTLETWFKRTNNTDTVAACERLINLNSSIVNATRTSLGLCGKNIAGHGRTTDNLANWVKDSNFVASTDWQMATLTYNSNTQAVKIYANAVLHSSTSQAILSGSSDNLLVGASASGGNAQNFAGQIATIRVYNRDLTASEISSNFEGEKSRFGFTDSSAQISVPVSLNIGTGQVQSTSQQVTVTLPNVAITDRRSNFAPYSTSLAISDLIQDNQRITKNNISVNFGIPVIEMGSGLNQTTGNGGTLDSAKNLLTNTASNGGGKFVYSPQLTVTIPAFAKQGIYTATLTFSVS